MSIKYVIASLVLLVGPVFGVTVAANERALDYVQIKVPGSVRTIAYGINAAGHVVGNYLSGDGTVDGAFILRGEDYETFVIPGAVWTEARGIGPGGEVVGIYSMNGRMRGFRRSRDGSVSAIDYPNQDNTMPIRVNPAGEVVGCYHGSNFNTTMFGFVLGAGGYSSHYIDSTMHNGISPDGGTIVGHRQTVGTPTVGYVMTQGNIEEFSVPGSNLTQAWDINAGREVVGVFRQAANGTFRGFLRSKSGEFTTLQYPGSLHTRAFGINSAGDIVGLYVKDGGTWGFLISRSRRMD